MIAKTRLVRRINITEQTEITMQQLRDALVAAGFAIREDSKLYVDDSTDFKYAGPNSVVLMVETTTDKVEYE